LTRPHRNVHFDGSFDGQKNAHRRPLSGVRCAIAVSMGSRWQIVQRRRWSDHATGGAQELSAGARRGGLDPQPCKQTPAATGHARHTIRPAAPSRHTAAAHQTHGNVWPRGAAVLATAHLAGKMADWRARRVGAPTTAAPGGGLAELGQTHSVGGGGGCPGVTRNPATLVLYDVEVRREPPQKGPDAVAFQSDAMRSWVVPMHLYPPLVPLYPSRRELQKGLLQRAELASSPNSATTDLSWSSSHPRTTVDTTTPGRRRIPHGDPWRGDSREVQTCGVNQKSHTCAHLSKKQFGMQITGVNRPTSIMTWRNYHLLVFVDRVP